ncbi:MAG: hypothetical protein RLZ84_993 [Actinomycetota bacterium]
MNLSRIDRNRLTFVGVITALVLPLMWMAQGRSDTAATTTTIDATTTTIAVGIGADATADAPANLEGPQSVGVAYPADESASSAKGDATFKRFPDSAQTGCATNAAPLGAVITVRNVNNGLKTECTNINIGYLPGGSDIVLNMAVFEKIAELIDAPLPVEMTW